MPAESGWLQIPAYVKDEGPLGLRAIHGMTHPVRKGISCPVHSHREIEIVYHPVGSGVTRLAGHDDIRFETGSFVLYAPEQRHDQVMDEVGEDACLQISVPSTLQRDLTGALHVPPPADPLLVAEMEILTRNHLSAHAYEHTVTHLRASVILVSLVQAAFAGARLEVMSRTQRYVADADAYLRDHFQTIGSLEDVSKYVGVSHSRLRHLFREHRGMSMIRRLNELRLERARSLLIHSRLPIKQVASLSGFRDEYYFSAVFRRFQQVAPKNYRENGGSPLSQNKRAEKRERAHVRPKR